jgi:hypothetical protein
MARRQQQHVAGIEPNRDQFVVDSPELVEICFDARTTQTINRSLSQFKALNGITAVSRKKDMEIPAVPSELPLALPAVKRLEAL